MNQVSTNFLKGFKINIVLRIFLLVILIFALSFAVLKSDFWTIIVLISIAIIFTIFEFIKYIEKFKNNFLYFLNSINQEDYLVSFSSANASLNDQKFSQVLNELADKFRFLRVKGETKHQYLNAIIKHINIGLIGYDHGGKITILNEAAKRFLKKPHLGNIESIKMFDETLYTEITALTSNRKTLVKLIKDGILLHLSIQATEIKIGEDYQKVISIQDIKNELDEKEVDSWQKLVRVINHEIMNSVIPISTLANVLRLMLDDYLVMGKIEQNKKEELISDEAEGIKTIEDRSKGLAEFVKATKSLTTISNPVFREIKIEEIFSRIEPLLNPGLIILDIHLDIKALEDGIKIYGDLELIEQVLINLIKNGQEAIEKRRIDSSDTTYNAHGSIKVVAKMEEKAVYITVSDNGVGINDT